MGTSPSRRRRRGQLEAVQAGHHQVDHRQVGQDALGQGQGRPTVRGGLDAVAVRLELGLQGEAQVGVVVRDQDARLGGGAVAGYGHAPLSPRLLPRQDGAARAPSPARGARRRRGATPPSGAVAVSAEPGGGTRTSRPGPACCAPRCCRPWPRRRPGRCTAPGPPPLRSRPALPAPPEAVEDGRLLVLRDRRGPGAADAHLDRPLEGDHAARSTVACRRARRTWPALPGQVDQDVLHPLGSARARGRTPFADAQPGRS